MDNESRKPPPGGQCMVSILVLTRNEEQDLPGCLESVKWSDDVHVYDSFSTDKTLEIARASGARVTQRTFDNYSAQRNWGLANIPFKHPWVFSIDADERMTPELVREVQCAVQHPGQNAAFRVRRRDFFMGRWLKHVQATPYYIRLFRPGKMHYKRLVHSYIMVSGEVGLVPGYLDHFPFSKGLAPWLDRHNKYSTFEAEQHMLDRAASVKFSFWKALFERDPQQRRFHQKGLFHRFKGRSFIRFLYLYVFRLGFLDGRPGLTYAVLQSIYEYMIVLKIRELSVAKQPLFNKDPLANQPPAVSPS